MNTYLRPLLVVVLSVSSACVAPPLVRAQVATDGTVGARVALEGPDYGIGADLGRIEGTNLFHSFERFGLATGERATFSGPDAIANVISRVTGGERSDIDGTIRSTIPEADFFFLNPAGVVFGPNAELDVQGSFRVSTADELRFSDGSAFSATDPDASSFTMARPEAFGFLGADPAPILIDRSTLKIEPGESFSIVGGDITIDDRAVVGTAAGTVDLFSLTGPGIADTVDGEATASRLGTVRIAGGSSLDAAGDGGGRIRIRAGRLEAQSGAVVVANNTGSSPPQAQIDVRAGEIVLDSALIINNGTASGGAGPIRVTGTTLTLTGDAAIGASAFAQGAAGTITLVGREAVTISGNGVFANSLSAAENSGDAGRIEIEATKVTVETGSLQVVTLGGGDAGTAFVKAGELNLSEGAQIAVGPFDGSSGNGGLAKIRVEQGFNVLENSNPQGRISGVFAAAEEGAHGDAGMIDIIAGSLNMIGRTRVTASGNEGRSGGIAIDLGTLRLGRGAQISASTDALEVPAEPGGTITVSASDLIMIKGFHPTILGPDGNPLRSGLFNDARGNADSGGISIAAPLLIVDGGRITSDTTLEIHGDPRITGRAGDIVIDLDRLVIRNEGQIFAGTDTAGDGGVVSVESDSILIQGTKNAPPDFPSTGSLTGVFSNVKEQGTGRGGRIVIRASDMRMVDGGRISTRTLGTGPAGAIEIAVANDVVLEDGLIETAVADLATTDLPANEDTAAGDLTVRARAIAVRDGGTISSRSERGPGAAGTITIVAPDTLELSGGAISSTSAESGGGRIVILVDRLIDLRSRSTIATSVFGGDDTTAGDITIDPRFLIVDSSAILARARAGRGGNIQIVAEDILRTPDSRIDASAETGIDGTVSISSPDPDIAGDLVILEGTLVDAGSLLRERCAARRDVGASSFTGVGRGGLPASPDDPLLGLPGVGSGAAQASSNAGGTEHDEAVARAVVAEPDSRAVLPMTLKVPCRGGL